MQARVMGREVYQVTDEGRRAYSSHLSGAHGPWDRFTPEQNAEAQAAFDEEDDDDLLPSCWITPTRTKEVDR